MSFWRISWQIYSHFLFPFQRITCVHRQINLCGVLSTIKILVWHRIVSHAWWRRLHKSLQKGINSQVRKEKAMICISPFVKTHNTQIQACMSTVWLVYCSFIVISKEQCEEGGVRKWSESMWPWRSMGMWTELLSTKIRELFKVWTEWRLWWIWTVTANSTRLSRWSASLDKTWHKVFFASRIFWTRNLSDLVLRRSWPNVGCNDLWATFDFHANWLSPLRIGSLLRS